MAYQSKTKEQDSTDAKLHQELYQDRLKEYK